MDHSKEIQRVVFLRRIKGGGGGGGGGWRETGGCYYC